jgi:hypothetical protein
LDFRAETRARLFCAQSRPAAYRCNHHEITIPATITASAISIQF